MNLSELDAEILEVEDQERRLVFRDFTHGDALDLGLHIIALAMADGVGIVADVTCDGRCLFRHAMAGMSMESNALIRCKQNTMQITGISSLLVYLRCARYGMDYPACRGAAQADHASCGGGFPLRRHDVGIFGYVTVSGYSDRADHALVVRALSVFCGHGL
ncbi:MAG: heme-binding protein [Planctomycetes bacterium]|nr:heme-binding protein [Planctomycetota bacterium]